MKTLALVATLTVASLARAGTLLEVDPSHAAAVFTVRHMTVMNVTGRLGTVTGTVDLDEKDVTRSKVQISIDIKGINTNEEKRDAHLRSADFFDTDKWPTATFTSTRIEKAGGRLRVTGDLTMHGVTRPVTLDAELSAAVPSPFNQKPVRAVQATTTINREDWGLTWNKPLANQGLLVSKEVKLAIDLELREPRAEKK